MFYIYSQKPSTSKSMSLPENKESEDSTTSEEDDNSEEQVETPTVVNVKQTTTQQRPFNEYHHLRASSISVSGILSKHVLIVRYDLLKPKSATNHI